MLSLLNGTVYAADYADQDQVSGPTINFDKMIVDNSSPDNIYIGNNDNTTQTILIGKDDIQKYNYSLQINDAFTVGAEPHQVTLNSASIDIKAGDGLGISVGSSYEKEGASSLTLLGGDFTYSGNGYGGISIAHGSFLAGCEEKWFENFTMQGGSLSIGVQPDEKINSYIYAKQVTIENNANGRGNAFDGDGYSLIAANTITLRGEYATANASSGTSGVLSFGQGSDNTFKAEEIHIEAEKINDVGNEYLYAIKSNLGSKDKAYELNINADRLLDIKGNILLDGKGTATFTGESISISGAMSGKGDDYDELGAGIVVNNASKLIIGTETEKANNVTITSKGAYGILLGGPKDSSTASENGQLETNVKNNLIVEATDGIGFAALRDHSKAELNTGSLSITGKTTGMDINVCDVTVHGTDTIKIIGKEEYGIKGMGSSPYTGYVSNLSYETTVTDSSEPAILISSKDNALNTECGFDTSFKATGGKIIFSSSDASGIYVDSNYYGDKTVLNKTVLESNIGINVYGADCAIEAYNKSHVELVSKNITLQSGDMDTNKNSVTATVYAEGSVTFNPIVDLGDGNGIVNILSNNKSVWASGDGGTVNITGAVNINAKYTGTDGTSLLADDEEQHIAIVAGVAGADSIDTNHGEVNVKLKGTDDSYITGDIVAARDGIVNITHEDYTGKLYITGDVLAGNGRIDSKDQQLGVANVDLGEGGYWAGRADDYQDAALKAESTYFDPHFTNGEVTAAGEVNITMGEGSVWNVTGQSWVTNLKGDKSTIILCGKDTSGNIEGTGGYSIHIGTLEGENTFVVNLNPEDVAGSDMIYIQDGTNAKQTLVVNNESELLNLQEGERIRFATIADAEGSFEYGGAYSGTGTFGETYTVKGRGLRNVELGVQYVDMDKEDENTYKDVGTEEAYNGGSSFTESNDKPGSSYVENTYDKIEEGKTSQNVYLVRNSSTIDPGDDDDLTDSGETIINMSHANYKNAVYMDRLNKRLGEARYIDGDEGMWVRLRHDRIGQQGEFRSMNTMYQLGYDKLDNKDDKGERHIGAAIDYMDGSTSYSDIYGEGETKRWGFWMYDTWLGNKGHYADYIVKFGHLHNDFDLRDKDSGEKVTGDYDNNVFSISAEYGRKKDIGNDWYIEPQAQLQLARVTDAEYTTSQGTDVYVDGINSLIGRIGFRLGKDVDERSTVYVKADVLHEFLGDQRIVAGDVTGALDKTYENSGTWYDVGFGFATAVGHNSYAYLDFEKSFGNDNDETYQINAGLQWSF